MLRRYWALLPILVAGCGGGMPAAGSVDGAPVDEIEEMERELLEVERELLAGAKEAEPSDGPAGAEGGLAAPATATEEPAASPPPHSEKVDETSDERERSSCKTACRALASMRRSADRICELAGAEHERCSWARERVADATGRVQRAGCSCE